MFNPQSQLEATAILFVLAVAVVDWRTHRIPNLLCAIGAVIGLSSQTWLHGEDGLLAALGGAAVGLGMFLPFYVVRAFGAGDVKAMATVGIFLGVEVTLFAVGATLIAGSVLGLAVMLLKPTPANATLHRLIGLLSAPVATMLASQQTAAPDSRQRFPYGVAIACGTAAALLVTR